MNQGSKLTMRAVVVVVVGVVAVVVVVGVVVVAVLMMMIVAVLMMALTREPVQARCGKPHPQPVEQLVEQLM